LNYVDGYSNPFTTPQSSIDSWTTADLTLQYDGAGILGQRRLRAALSVKNILDESPPAFVGGFTGVLYDTANASPFGRFISAGVAVSW
jgi:outer membrane receptor protein involved in Fe transport